MIKDIFDIIQNSLTKIVTLKYYTSSQSYMNISFKFSDLKLCLGVSVTDIQAPTVSAAETRDQPTVEEVQQVQHQSLANQTNINQFKRQKTKHQEETEDFE